MIESIAMLALAVPVGLLLAWMAKDELVIGRLWFKILMGVSTLAGAIFYTLERHPSAFASLFILVATSISYLKSKRKVKRRI